MKNRLLDRIGLNQRLAILALALAAVAAVGEPRGEHTVTLDARELALIVQREVDHVTVQELAEWIVAGRADYRLLDVRDGDAYAAYHIPTAESVSLAELADYPLYRNEKIVVYSDGGIHAAQAWFLLVAEGYRGAYILLGGLDAWTNDVLFPELPASSGPEEMTRFARTAEVSRFFGGSPRTGGTATADAQAVEMPEVAAPTAPPARQPKRKTKDGC